VRLQKLNNSANKTSKDALNFAHTHVLSKVDTYWPARVTTMPPTRDEGTRKHATVSATVAWYWHVTLNALQTTHAPPDSVSLAWPLHVLINGKAHQCIIDHTVPDIPPAPVTTRHRTARETENKLAPCGLTVDSSQLFPPNSKSRDTPEWYSVYLYAAVLPAAVVRVGLHVNTIIRLPVFWLSVCFGTALWALITTRC